MPILGNPLIYWNVLCIGQEYIIWYITVQGNFILYVTKEEHKASYKRSCMGDQGTQYLMKYQWK